MPDPAIVQTAKLVGKVAYLRVRVVGTRMMDKPEAWVHLVDKQGKPIEDREFCIPMGVAIDAVRVLEEMRGT